MLVQIITLFIDEETDAKKNQKICPRSFSVSMMVLELETLHSDSRAWDLTNK